MSHFSKTLKGQRLDLRFTQAELARRLKVTRTTIAHFESGRCTPTLPHLYALMRILKLTPNEILGVRKVRTK